MKQYEKIIIIVAIVSFVLQVLPFSGIDIFFCLSNFILSMSYFFGGCLLLNTDENRNFALPVIAGVAFSASLFFLNHMIRLIHEYYFYFMPVANGLLFIVLGIYLFHKRKSPSNTRNIRSIFIRSFIILIISSLFTYTPITFKPFRAILFALNNGNYKLQNNMLMFDYKDLSEDAIENGDCLQAIEYALKANKAGKIWLGIVDEENSEKIKVFLKCIRNRSIKYPTDISYFSRSLSYENNIWKIDGTFYNIYMAYKCRADAEYENNNFEYALINYNAAYFYLMLCNKNANFKYEEKSASINKIALCNKKLNRFAIADSILKIARIDSLMKVEISKYTRNIDPNLIEIGINPK